MKTRSLNIHNTTTHTYTMKPILLNDHRNVRGLTLVQTLVVIGIIGFAALTLLPLASKALITQSTGEALDSFFKDLHSGRFSRAEAVSRFGAVAVRHAAAGDHYAMIGIWRSQLNSEIARQETEKLALENPKAGQLLKERLGHYKDDSDPYGRGEGNPHSYGPYIGEDLSVFDASCSRVLQDIKMVETVKFPATKISIGNGWVTVTLRSATNDQSDDGEYANFPLAWAQQYEAQLLHASSI